MKPGVRALLGLLLDRYVVLPVVFRANLSEHFGRIGPKTLD